MRAMLFVFGLLIAAPSFAADPFASAPGYELISSNHTTRCTVNATSVYVYLAGPDNFDGCLAWVADQTGASNLTYKLNSSNKYLIYSGSSWIGLIETYKTATPSFCPPVDHPEATIKGTNGLCYNPQDLANNDSCIGDDGAREAVPVSGLQKSEACYAKPDGSKCYMQPQQMPDGNTYYVAQSEDSGQCYDPGTTLPFVDYPDPDPTDPGDGGGDTDPTDPGDGGDGGDTTDPTTPGDGDTDPTDPSNDPNFQKVLDAIEAFKAGNLSALDDLAKSNAQHLDNVTDAVNGVGQAVGNVGDAVNNLNQTATGNGQKLDALNQTNSDGFQEVGGKLGGIKDGIDGIGDGLNWNPGNASGHTCELLCSAFNQQAVDDIIQRAQEYKAKVASLNTDIHTYMASMFSLDVSGGSYRDYSISTTLGTVDVPFWEDMQQLRYILAIIVMLFATFYVIKVVL